MGRRHGAWTLVRQPSHAQATETGGHLGDREGPLADGDTDHKGKQSAIRLVSRRCKYVPDVRRGCFADSTMLAIPMTGRADENHAFIHRIDPPWHACRSYDCHSGSTMLATPAPCHTDKMPKTYTNTHSACAAHLRRFQHVQTCMSETPHW